MILQFILVKLFSSEHCPKVEIKVSLRSVWVTKLLIQLVLMSFGIQGPTPQDKNEFWAGNLERLDKISNNMLESRDWGMGLTIFPAFIVSFRVLHHNFISSKPYSVRLWDKPATLSLIPYSEI